MYASNEDEFNREHDDWVFLRQSLPIASSMHGAMNLVDHEQTISSSSTSTSSSESSLSTSERSDSVSSIEIEQDKNEEPVLTSQTNDLVVEGELKEQGLSSEIPIKQVSEGETSPVINEYELPHSACDSSQETITSTSHLRRRTGANVQETGDQYVPTIEHGSRSARSSSQHPRKRNVLLIYGILVLLLALPIVLCRFATSQRHVLDKITENLQQTNQRLDQIKNVPIEDLEQKLTKQLEEKFQGILKQKTIEHNLEKFSLVSQINELYHIVHMTQLNLTNTIHQLSSENERLQKQVIGLEERQHLMEEQQAKINTTCSKNTDETKATASPLENIISNVIKQTASITTNTSENLAGFFEQLSTKISDFVDNRHEYVEETKQKLNNFAKSKTAEKVKKTIRRSVENFSSSIHQAQTSYATWMRSRAEQREQARMDSKEFEDNGKSTRRPWRWTFQRSHDREKLRHQIPVTKKHTSNKEYVCHPNYDFPVNQLCTMKNWMDKLFQP